MTTSFAVRPSFNEAIDVALQAKREALGVPTCGCDGYGDPDITGLCRTCAKPIVALTHEEYVAAYESAGWRTEACSRCGGRGVIWVGDSSPDGLVDCRCAGGTVWITPTGRRVAWPGGPFC